jgi:hypothetical protein
MAGNFDFMYLKRREGNSLNRLNRLFDESISGHAFLMKIDFSAPSLSLVIFYYSQLFIADDRSRFRFYFFEKPRRDACLHKGSTRHELLQNSFLFQLDDCIDHSFIVRDKSVATG